MMRIISLGLLILMVAGCSVAPIDSAEKGRSINPADTLLAQANAKASRGETRQAIAVLERAVRLQPRDANAWLRLAELYLNLGEFHKAEQFARRSQQFMARDKKLLRRAERVIQQAIAGKRTS